MSWLDSITKRKLYTGLKDKFGKRIYFGDSYYIVIDNNRLGAYYSDMTCEEQSNKLDKFFAPYERVVDTIPSKREAMTMEII